MSDSWPPARIVELIKTLEAEGEGILAAFHVDTYKDWAERAKRKLEVSSDRVHTSFKTASGGPAHVGMDLSVFYRNSLVAKLRILRAWREALEMETEHRAPTVDTPHIASSRKIFIVHGHNVGVMREVEAFVRSLEFEPIILQDQANLGRTLIEKFEQNADVGYAIILMTADDVGASKREFASDHDALSARARQNVVLELGFFVGRLRRKQIAVLYEDGVEMPSDFEGVAYILIDGHEGWKFKLQRELKEAYASQA